MNEDYKEPENMYERALKVHRRLEEILKRKEFITKEEFWRVIVAKDKENQGVNFYQTIGMTETFGNISNAKCPTQLVIKNCGDDVWQYHTQIKIAGSDWIIIPSSIKKIVMHNNYSITFTNFETTVTIN